MKRLMTVMAIAATTLCLVVVGAGEARAAARADAPQPRQRSQVATDRRAEVAAILSVLERRIADPNARQRAAEKLGRLSDRQIDLLASLSGRLAVDGDGPAAGVGLLLITALLILS